MQKQITNKESRDTLLKGINKVGDIVRKTLGPFGSNVCINNTITNDGVTIAQSIILDDQAEDLGAYLIKKSASLTNDTVGDGTTTTTILTQELCNSFSGLVDRGMSSIKIKKDTKEALNIISNNLKQQASKCNTITNLSAVATISVEDKKLGEMIAETVLFAGENGIINVIDSKNEDTYKELFTGLKIERGWASPYLCTNPTRLEALFEGTKVLVTDETITNFDDLIPILEKLKNASINKIVIICEDITGSALTDVINNNMRSGINILAVRGPIGTQKKGGMMDIAIATGAKLFTSDVGSHIRDAEIRDLGYAEVVLANKNETNIIGGAGSKKAINDRVSEIKTEIDLSNSDYEKEKLKERIARLASGVGFIYVGNGAEHQYLKMKIEDAVNATRQALIGGVVAGSGYGLLKAASNLPEDNGVFSAIKDACLACTEQILTNSGINSYDKISILNNIIKEGSYYNIVTEKYFKDPIKEKVIDPVNVVVAAITNASTTAGLFCTIEGLISDTIEQAE